MKFAHPGDSHLHSLDTLNLLYEYDDFMLSIRSVIDLGCGDSNDLVWWATRTTRDDAPLPLNIQCTGVDINDSIPRLNTYPNINYQITDFESQIDPFPKGYDILWCHDSFQYATNPLQTLKNWWHLASPGGMLYICVPITQQLYHRQLDYSLASGAYYHHTVVSLIYMLATCGWDCRSGFFKQTLSDPFIHLAVYKSEHQPMDPKVTSWYALSELQLLPESADQSVLANGYLKQTDLVVPWLDHSLTSMTIK
jgi:SAM-dependent methyltransferase